MLESELKILWARASGYCAMCKTRLVEEAQDGTPYVLGESAHIYGDKPGSERYEISMSDEERNAYANRILLCPTDHTKIDKKSAAIDYPVEALQQLKRDHEEWATRNLEAALPQLTFAELEIALKYIVNADLSTIEDLALIHPLEKIQKNQLSSAVDRLIRMGLSQGGLVREYFNRNFDIEFAERIRAGFIEKYNEFKAQSLEADVIFYDLVKFASGNSQDFKIHTAGLCLVCYFFEQCDIFEK